MTKYPKACYTLDKIRKQVLCEWVKNLRYPDGYASNLARCVDMQKLKLFGMKSHDCHFFMQRLLLAVTPQNLGCPLTIRQPAEFNVSHVMKHTYE